MIKNIVVLVVLIVPMFSFGQNEVVVEVIKRDNGEMVMHCYFTTIADEADIFNAIASTAGLSKWAAPAALVELKIGGAYELYFRPANEKGKRGMEGNKVLSYNLNKMISYSGGLPETWVVYSIEPDEERRKVHFYGIGTHPEWVSKCEQQAPAVRDFIQKLADHLRSGN